MLTPPSTCSQEVGLSAAPAGPHISCAAGTAPLPTTQMPMMPPLLLLLSSSSSSSSSAPRMLHSGVYTTPTTELHPRLTPLSMQLCTLLVSLAHLRRSPSHEQHGRESSAGQSSRTRGPGQTSTEVTLPEVPLVTLPEVPLVTLPEVPQVTLPEVPLVTLPEVPLVTLPEVPQ
ncbi:hypothetical protein CRUP_026913, partial [Coryphaenoides rupestris]